MNNLKRVLSLALSGIMLVGMMAVGAGAVDYKDFTDKDEINHTEAVSSMTLLGVIAGKDTGAFDPKGTVTRAEMAKMLTVALNGGKDPILGTKSTPTFSDIKGHWAEQYIEYCTSLAIIAGQGDGTFAPDQTVTGTQAAKMMLTAMGYEAEVYNLVGADWAINTNREANDAGLYEELETLDPNAGLSRDDAAQLIWNGIQKRTLTKTPTKSVTTGEITFEYSRNGSSILVGKFKVYTNYGQLVSVDEGDLSIKFDANYLDEEGRTGSVQNFRKVTTDYSSYLGYTVKVLYKGADEVVGVAPLDGNTTYTTDMSVIENDSGKVKFGGSKYSIEQLNNTFSGGNNGTWTLGNNAKSIDVITISHDGNVTNTTGTAADFHQKYTSYNTVTFVDNDNDGNLEYAIVKEVVPGKVTYSSKDEVIVGGFTYDREDDNVPEDLARDGYAAASYNVFNANYDVTELKQASGVAVEDNNDAAAAGKRYKFDGEGWFYRGGRSLTDAVNAGDTYDYYVCNTVLVETELSKTATTLDNLVMIVRKATSGLDDQVRVIYTDGSQRALVVVDDDYTTNDVNYDALAAGELYTVAETSKGYTFKLADENATGNDGKIAKIGDYTFVNGKANDVDTASSKVHDFDGTLIADDAIIFLFAGTAGAAGDDGHAKIVTGKQLKTLDADGSDTAKVNTESFGYFTSKRNGLTRATVAGIKFNGTTLPSLSAANDKYALIVSDGIQIDSTWAEYQVWTGEETLTVREKTRLDLTSSKTDRRKFSVITYDKIADGVIDNVDELKQLYGTQANTTYQAAGESSATQHLNIAGLASVASSKVWLDDTTSVDRVGDTVYMYYDSSESSADKIGKLDGELVRADSATRDELVPNVKYVADGSDLNFVLIDVKNMVKDKKAQTAAAITATAYTINADARITFSKTQNIVKGETLTMTVTVAAGKTLNSVALNLNNAKNAVTGGRTFTIPTLTAPSTSSRTYDFSVVATTTGAAITVTP